MAISRFQSSFKVRTDLMDNMTPNNVVQREVSTPAGEWKPASWLPTIWQNEKSKDYFTISSGKVVSFDASGRIVPSGLLRKGLDIIADPDPAVDDTATLFSYDSNDVAARVIDIRTGKFVLEADVGPVSLQAFVNAVVESGWSFEPAVVPADAAADREEAAKAILKSFISAPVGVAAYDVYVWAGDDPANLHYTNYQKQHLIQFFTDIQMRVPHVCKKVKDVDLIVDPAVQLSGLVLSAMPRYAGLDMSNVVGYRADSAFASNTSRTPIDPLQNAGGANWVGRERSEIALLARDGDYYLDGDAGLVLFYIAGGAGVPQDATLNAAGAAAPEALAAGGKAHSYIGGATEEGARMIHLVGAARPGDFVTFDVESNFVVRSLPFADGLEAVADEMELTVGRILELIKEPRGLLERVRTGFQGDEFAADAKMPGSATGGFSDLITLSDEIVADEIAVINIKVQ